jgi:hypothetical protein
MSKFRLAKSNARGANALECAGGHDPEVVMIEAVVPVKAD